MAETAYGSYSNRRQDRTVMAGVKVGAGATALAALAKSAPLVAHYGRLTGRYGRVLTEAIGFVSMSGLIGGAAGGLVGAAVSRRRGEGSTGQQRAINHLVKRAKYEKRARQQAVNGYVTVKGHYTTAGTFVRQHQRRVG